MECGDKQYGDVYTSIDAKFRRSIRRLPDGASRLNALERQGDLVDCILNLARGIRLSKDPLFRKIEKLQTQLHDAKHPLHSLLPVPLPLDANVTVTGVVAGIPNSSHALTIRKMQHLQKQSRPDEASV